MKIYSNVLTGADLYNTIDPIPGMYILEIEDIARCRVRKRGWELQTASTTSNRWKNSGNRGGYRTPAASRDDHGHWFRALFNIDPKAKIAGYDGVQDFHKKTFNRYQPSLAG